MADRYGFIEPVDLPLAHLPAGLEGLRIAQVSDLHVRRPRRMHERLIDQLTRHRLDIVALTGDYMEKPGHEPAAMEVLGRLVERVRPRLGVFGVFGNHDTAELREQAAGLAVQWLSSRTVGLSAGQLEVSGLDAQGRASPDSVALALQRPKGGGEGDGVPVRLLLSHLPSCFTTAAELGYDVMLCGHTHGGQCRLPGGRALVTACDIPARCGSGLLRHRDTLIGLTRGVGYTTVIPRVLCPPQVPLYTLRGRPCPGEPTRDLVTVVRW